LTHLPPFVLLLPEDEAEEAGVEDRSDEEEESTHNVGLNEKMEPPSTPFAWDGMCSDLALACRLWRLMVGGSVTRAIFDEVEKSSRESPDMIECPYNTGVQRNVRLDADEILNSLEKMMGLFVCPFCN
jgi:hypothetical protein